MNHQKKGFTLIEMLVVVAVIAILASILFPVFARARESARRASCMSNLKQIGLGVMMYVQDYDEKYPMCHDNAPNAGNWGTFLTPYVKNSQVYVCPSSSISSYTSGNYGANRAMLVDGDAEGNAGWQTLSIAAMPSAAGTYMLTDASGTRISAYNVSAGANNGLFLPGTGPGSTVNLPVTQTGTAASKQDDFERGRHFGGVNMLFADGHVKWLQSQVVWKEAAPCGSSSCFPWKSHTATSAWNPWVDH